MIKIIKQYSNNDIIWGFGEDGNIYYKRRSYWVPFSINSGISEQNVSIMDLEIIIDKFKNLKNLIAFC